MYCDCVCFFFRRSTTLPLITTPNSAYFEWKRSRTEVFDCTTAEVFLLTTIIRIMDSHYSRRICTHFIFPIIQYDDTVGHSHIFRWPFPRCFVWKQNEIKIRFYFIDRCFAESESAENLISVIFYISSMRCKSIDISKMKLFFY